MKEKEYEFKGLLVNGFLMLFLLLAVIGLSIYFAVATQATLVIVICSLCIFFAMVFCFGFRMLEPNEGMVMLFLENIEVLLRK